MSHVKFYMSCVTCHVTGVRCHVSGYIIELYDKVLARSCAENGFLDDKVIIHSFGNKGQEGQIGYHYFCHENIQNYALGVENEQFLGAPHRFNQ